MEFTLGGYDKPGSRDILSGSISTVELRYHTLAVLSGFLDYPRNSYCSADILSRDS